MNKREIILAGLASAKSALHSPVQVQKLFFLIDKNISDIIGGPFFEFQPYQYGPFDHNVYRSIEELAKEGLVEIIQVHNWKEYKLSEIGLKLGIELLEGLPNEAKLYIEQVSDFVRKLSFTQLVSAIYKAYPEMRTNSVFQE